MTEMHLAYGHYAIIRLISVQKLPINFQNEEDRISTPIPHHNTSWKGNEKEEGVRALSY